MAVLFISHSSKDDALVTTLDTWLKAGGFTDTFVDHLSIQGGDKWDDALRASAGMSRVVLCIVTPLWLASDECFNEFRAAWYMGKRIVPLFLLPPDTKIDAASKDRLAKVTAEAQGLDLLPCINEAGALDLDALPAVAERLKAGLRAAGALTRIGLDPEAFEIDRAVRPTPFPGLAAFGDEDADAALFYGRSREIAHTLEELRAMRAVHDQRPLVILGASGAGKSSLLKAGLIPRLRREASWLPLHAFRPGNDPLLNFAEALAHTMADYGLHEAHGVIRDRLVDAWSRAERDPKRALTVGGSAMLEAALEELGQRLRKAADRPGATILVSIDQAEELTRAEDASGEALADYLRVALNAKSSPWQLAFTIRTDSFPELQSHRRFQSLEARGYDLRALPVFRFDNVVEEPAKRYGVTVDVELVYALMEDAPKEDALPLLAFALERLWRQYAASGQFTKTNYDKVGGLKGLIEDAAERALRGIEPGQDVPPGPLAKRVDALGAATFVPALVQINDQGATIRRVAAWKDLPEDSQHLLQHFDRWRLVVRKGTETEGGTVEVAHEALFREWNRLKGWLEPERERLDALRSLQIDAATWSRNGSSPAFLNHRDKRLVGATALAADAKYAKRMEAAERDYIAACAKAEAADRAQARRGKALVAMMSLMLAGAGVSWWKQDVLREQVHWHTQAAAKVLKAADETKLAAAPGSEFQECANGCPTMIVVPPGKFLMGTKDATGDEGPQHEVTIIKPFAVGKFAVTFAEWDQCLAAGACPKASDVGWGRNNRPVIKVSWDDAKQFAGWLSRMSGKDYRLLSEAEWEYAARAGSSTTFSFGDDPEQLGKYAWYANNSDSRSQPVGRKKPNAFGLYDMHGNVWQWTEDHWHDRYEQAPTDGSAWTKVGYADRRVVRGGSWVDSPDIVRSAYRSGYLSDDRSDYLGFRVARTLTP